MNLFKNFISKRSDINLYQQQLPRQQHQIMSSRNNNSSGSTRKQNSNQNNHNNHHHNQQVVTSMFGNVLDTMDRFLEKEDNLIVQALVTIQERTNISKRYLARIMLILTLGYLIFSYSFLDSLARVFTLLYPSYRTYIKLKYFVLTKDQFINLLKFWIFISFFTIVDILFGSWIPLGFFLKGIIIVQIVIPQNPQAIDFVFENIIKPIYDNLETNERLQQLNQYFREEINIIATNNAIENEYNE